MPEIELSPGEEVLIDVEEDPLKLNDTDMEYVEDKGQVEMGNTEDGNNTPKQGGKVDDEESSEFKPYSYFVNNEIDISAHRGEKVKAPVNSQTLPTVVEDMTKIPHTNSAPTTTQSLPTVVEDIAKVPLPNPSTAENTPSSSKAPQTQNPVSSQATTSNTNKSSRGGDKLCLRNPTL